MVLDCDTGPYAEQKKRTEEPYGGVLCDEAYHEQGKPDGDGGWLDFTRGDEPARAGVIWQPGFDRFILAAIFANTYALAMDHHSEADCLSTFQPEQPCQVPQRTPKIAGLPGADSPLDYRAVLCG